MQLTRFDRWLRENYVYEIHIQTLRPIDILPPGVRAVDIPDVPGKRYKFLYVASNSPAADQLIEQLKQGSQMYTTQVVDRDKWYVPLIAPKEASVAWWLVTLVFVSVASFFVLLYLKILLQNPEIRENLNEALNILKG